MKNRDTKIGFPHSSWKLENSLKIANNSKPRKCTDSTVLCFNIVIDYIFLANLYLLLRVYVIFAAFFIQSEICILMDYKIIFLCNTTNHLRLNCQQPWNFGQCPWSTSALDFLYGYNKYRNSMWLLWTDKTLIE